MHYWINLYSQRQINFNKTLKWSSEPSPENLNFQIAAHLKPVKIYDRHIKCEEGNRLPLLAYLSAIWHDARRKKQTKKIWFGASLGLDIFYKIWWKKLWNMK